jgi:hypothetical protein
MTSRPILILLIATWLSPLSHSDESFDYFQSNRLMIRNGVQALLMCNGLFTSERSLEQVFEQELAYLTGPRGEVLREDFAIDDELRAVSVGGGISGPVVHTAYRDGIGCVVMAPEQTFANIDSLPEFSMPPLAGDSASITWPMGDARCPTTSTRRPC